MISHYENIDTRVTAMQKNSGDQDEFDITGTRNFLDDLFLRDRRSIYQEILNRRKIRIGRVEQEALGALFDKAGLGENTEFAAGYTRPLFGTTSNFSRAECEAWIKDKQAHNLDFGLSAEDVRNGLHAPILLLECYFTTGFFNLFFERLCLFFLHICLKHGRGGIYQIFSFLETKTENLFDYLDDGNLVGATVSEFDRRCRLLFYHLAGLSCHNWPNSDGGSRNPELVFKDF